MDHECKEEILSLLESPELREYLLAPPEKLCCAQYAEINCGAPVPGAAHRVSPASISARPRQQWRGLFRGRSCSAPTRLAN